MAEGSNPSRLAALIRACSCNQAVRFRSCSASTSVHVQASIRQPFGVKKARSCKWFMAASAVRQAFCERTEPSPAAACSWRRLSRTVQTCAASCTGRWCDMLTAVGLSTCQPRAERSAVCGDAQALGECREGDGSDGCPACCIRSTTSSGHLASSHRWIIPDTRCTPPHICVPGITGDIVLVLNALRLLSVCFWFTHMRT